MAATASSSAIRQEATSRIAMAEADPPGEIQIESGNTDLGGEITIAKEVEDGIDNMLHFSDTGGSESDLEMETAVEQLLEEAVESSGCIQLLSRFDPLGLTKLLHHAARGGNIELLNILLDDDSRTDVNAQLELGCTALILACWRGHTECVRFLLSKGVDVLVGTEDGLTCLHMAAFSGHIEVVNLLLHGRSHRERFDEANSSLPDLYSKRCWALIERRTGLEMFTALHMAANVSLHPWIPAELEAAIGTSKAEMLEKLKTFKMFDPVGLKNSPFKFWFNEVVQQERVWLDNLPASHDQGVSIVSSILEALRASVLDFFELSSNPKGEFDIEDELWLKFLLRFRKALHLQDGEISRQVMLENLAAYGCDGGAGSAIQKKLGDKYEGLVRAYVELILYSNAKDRIGRTALHHAALEGKDRLVKLLMWDSEVSAAQDCKWLNKCDPLKSQLGSVTNINAVDFDGHTPLHLASRKGHRDVVEELLRGCTFASALVPLLGLPDVHHNLLEKYFTEENFLEPNPAGNPCGRSQEIARVVHGREEMLGSKSSGSPKQLPRPSIKNSIWSEDRKGITPLHYAVENEYTEVVDVLLMHPKIDVFQCASNGQSPWSIAFPSSSNLIRCQSMETQRSLRGDIKSSSFARSSRVLCVREPHFSRTFYWRKLLREHQQRLLKRATALALAAPNDSASSDSLEILEEQIFLAFEGALHISYIEWQAGAEIKQIDIPWPAGAEFTKSDIGWYGEKDFPRSNFRPVLEENGNNYRKRHYPANLLHVAAYYGCKQELKTLLSLPTFGTHLNDRMWADYGGDTPLNLAIKYGGRDVVAVLMNEETLSLANLSFRNLKGPLSLEYIFEHPCAIGLNPAKFSEDIEQLIIFRDLQAFLLDTPSILQLLQKTSDNLYRDRQVYVDAANAILVGAALIASVTFAGYLQPPLGYVPFFTEYFPYPAPPSTVENFAAVGERNSVRVFWVFNGLSFFSAIATVLAGAGAVLPSSSNTIENEAFIARRWLSVTAGLLAVSILCVLGAFTAAGSASLPHISKYQFNIVTAAAIGLALCLATLGAFCYRLILSLNPSRALKVFFLLVPFEVCIGLFLLCRPLMHRIANG